MKRSFVNYLAATSNLGGGSMTNAEFVDGVAGGSRTVNTTFSLTPSGPVSNDDLRSSDVFTITGTDTDIFVLQLATDSVTSANFLGWVENGEWVNAIDGNSAIGDSAVQGFLGSYAAANLNANADFLGSWGVDADANSVWAILDHNSEFAVVPESSTVGILLSLCALGVTFVRRRTCKASLRHS